MERFNEILRRVLSDPGILKAKAMVTDTPAFMPDARETYVVESVRTDMGTYIFLEVIDADGQAHRLALPPKVSSAIYRQRESLTKRSRKRGARASYETQIARGLDPAERLRRKQEIGEV